MNDQELATRLRDEVGQQSTPTGTVWRSIEFRAGEVPGSDSADRAWHLRAAAAAAVFLMVGAGVFFLRDDRHRGDLTVSSTPTEAVDPAVLEAVTAAAFPVGGPSMRSGMRASAGLNNAIAEHCGGLIVDVNATDQRIDQSTYPDLDLIAERGFVEPIDSKSAGWPVEGTSNLVPDLRTAEEDFNAALRASDPSGANGEMVDAAALDANELYEACATEVVPASSEFYDLVSVWGDRTDEVLARQELRAMWPGVAACMTAATGSQVSESNPAEAFFGLIDGKELDEARQHDLTQIWVECTTDYFGTLQSLLEVEQAELAHTYGPTLQSVAASLQQAGYTP